LFIFLHGLVCGHLRKCTSGGAEAGTNATAR
jgi:hypothetical protein